MTGIEVEGVRRAFGNAVAVEDISLHARPGRVTALVGPNGAGKTTLLLMLASLLAPDSGSIRIDGVDPVTQPRQVRERIGWMPDGFGTWDALTVREVLTIVGSAYNLPPTRITERTEELLKLLHLTDLADRRARVLSRGQKQRLGLARALIHDPSVLLLDEPASGLDPRSRIELRDVVRQLAAEGRTILISSHILTELQEMADDAVIVAGGRTVERQEMDRQSNASHLSRWRVTGPDMTALRRHLDEHHIAWTEDPAGLVLDVMTEAGAAALLTQIVTGGVAVTTYAPTHNALETAYLAATEERR